MHKTIADTKNTTVDTMCDVQRTAKKMSMEATGAALAQRSTNVEEVMAPPRAIRAAAGTVLATLRNWATLGIIMVLLVECKRR